jgi:hypothetical protein
MDPNLVVVGKTIHKLSSNTLINNLIYEHGKIVVLEARFIQILEVHAHANGALIFINGCWVGNPFDQGNQVYESNINLSTSTLMATTFQLLNRHRFCETIFEFSYILISFSTILGSAHDISS